MGTRIRRGAGLAVAMAALLAPATASAAGQAYYVDCAGGSDAQAGTSTAQAWQTLAKVSATTFQPGDTISFRRGTRCTGSLIANGSGTAGAPIVVGAYGTGAAPQLDGAGARQTILIQGVHGWEIRDLDVSDAGPAPQIGELRTGILFLNASGDHFVVQNVHVHDIDSSSIPTLDQLANYENFGKSSGGIVARGGNLNDVLIADNTLDNVDREGIYINGGAPTTGLVVRGNTLRDIGGDGIVASGSTGALMERNVVDGFNQQGLLFNAGIWAYNSSDAVIQFNEVMHGAHGPLDSMAYDIDGGDNGVTFQYNLSHDNSGGFLMACNDTIPLSAGVANGRNVVRYNISQNDYAIGRGVIDAPITCAISSDVAIYNNTIYTRNPLVLSMVENTERAGMHFTNNVFVGPGPTATIVDGNSTWSHNLYVGVTCVLRAADPGHVIGDPRFVAPGTGAAGYRLKTGSPALNAGTVVANNGGRDYFGNPVPADQAPNIGAYQGPGISAGGLGLLGGLGSLLPAIALGC
jgi:hypothetical protein